MPFASFLASLFGSPEKKQKLKMVVLLELESSTTILTNRVIALLTITI